ncbi:hypothetical protein A2291_00315 [candidate division WOR-1 bacterium RIFOXYB2_FULL_42_35]|uniref:acylphosphatase n=1 Tax=candidate division WOR-1 bacterium RIFOXYC2_FULL_41_25 TaxID=1802586 RepID=A0A1F4TME3_UNCSA|nr:MAG: hypothetical protein A2247_01450 [candidate division WOR-1 bacterium RIFOXYA2_FULL_41_14]OGC24245.1 MAG: hypothetical protein A2291_00315 [candidate division WOR-1 bacterium RIFOXYB2_FULL_42_35]OGC33888.1 MAG: hypothetical protein A2462_01285 [candidate division WOR-1 bacterium RIFOXYC2_FULL_41_25]
MKRAHVIYSGNVQGVGFRYTAVNCARGFAVTGWVQNTADRKVELIAEGQEIEIKNFLADLKSQMSSFIRDEQISWEPATGEFGGFKINF